MKAGGAFHNYRRLRASRTALDLDASKRLCRRAVRLVLVFHRRSLHCSFVVATRLLPKWPWILWMNARSSWVRSLGKSSICLSLFSSSLWINFRLSVDCGSARPSNAVNARQIVRITCTSRLNEGGRLDAVSFGAPRVAWLDAPLTAVDFGLAGPHPARTRRDRKRSPVAQPWPAMRRINSRLSFFRSRTVTRQRPPAPGRTRHCRPG